MDEENAGHTREGSLEPTNVFADTSVLLNYVQRGIERDVTSELIDGTQVDVVIGITVAEELDQVGARRADIYPDFIDFLLSEDAEIDEYDPDTRRPYFQENDRTHVRDIQMQLSQIDERAEVLRQLRRFTRMAQRRLDYLREEVLVDSVFDQQPGMSVMFALQPVIANDNDRNVVGDAALWTAEADDSSGVFVTMDRADIVDIADEINSALREVKDERWELTIVLPTALSIEHDTNSATVADVSEN